MSRHQFNHVFSTILEPDAVEGVSSVEMVLAEQEFVARAQLDPSEQWVITDIFLRDLSDFRPASMPALERALLVINDVSARVGDYSVYIDGRAMLALSGRLRSADMTPESYAVALPRWIAQASRLSDMVSALGMEHFTLTYPVSDGSPLVETQS